MPSMGDFPCLTLIVPGEVPFFPDFSQIQTVCLSDEAELGL